MKDVIISTFVGLSVISAITAFLISIVWIFGENAIEYLVAAPVILMCAWCLGLVIREL
jgi:hypothetical protein